MSDGTFLDTAPEADDECNHLCSMGCGNRYEFVVTTVSDMSSLALCVPCFIGNATAMLTAITEPDNPDVQEAMRLATASETSRVKGRGRKQQFIGGMDTEPDFSMFDEFEPDVREL